MKRQRPELGLRRRVATRWLHRAAAFALLAIPACAQTVTATLDSGAGPVSVAINPATNMIYVANSQSASVTVIDGANNGTTTVTTGSSPAVAVNPVTNNIYVANKGSASVTVIDGASRAPTLWQRAQIP